MREVIEPRADTQVDLDAASIELVHFAGRSIGDHDLRPAGKGRQDPAGDVLRQAAAETACILSVSIKTREQSRL